MTSEPFDAAPRRIRPAPVAATCQRGELGLLITNVFFLLWGLALDIVAGMVVMVPLLIPRVNPGAWRWHVGTLACEHGSMTKAEEATMPRVRSEEIKVIGRAGRSRSARAMRARACASSGARTGVSS